MMMTRGFRGYYSSSYVLNLPNPSNKDAVNNASRITKHLKNCNFIDMNTRAFIVEFVLVNPSFLDVLITVNCK